MTEGNHTVRFEYVPKYFYAGAVISFIALGFAIVMVLKDREKRRLMNVTTCFKNSAFLSFIASIQNLYYL